MSHKTFEKALFHVDQAKTPFSGQNSTHLNYMRFFIHKMLQLYYIRFEIKEQRFSQTTLINNNNTIMFSGDSKWSVCRTTYAAKCRATRESFERNRKQCLHQCSSFTFLEFELQFVAEP